MEGINAFNNHQTFSGINYPHPDMTDLH